MEKEKWITDNEYYFLLASLIETVDKRANTASVYGAFLKQLKDGTNAICVKTGRVNNEWPRTPSF